MTGLDFLGDYLVVGIVGICLCEGFVVKKWIADVDNKYIPTLCAVLGLFLALLYNGWTFSPEVILQGLASGLAATGLFEAFRNFIDKGGK